VQEVWGIEIAATGVEVDLLDPQREALDQAEGAAVEYWDMAASWRGIYGIWPQPNTGNHGICSLARPDRDVGRAEGWRIVQQPAARHRAWAQPTQRAA
jgi:hypothetical protein